MFSNNKKPQVQKVDEIDTVIGPGTKFEGEIKAIGIVRIDGVFSGEISTQGDIIVGDQGEANGNLSSNNMIIAGKSNAKLKCKEKLEIRSSGTVIGDVEVKNIVIEENAVFKGQCVMENEDTANNKEKASDNSKKQNIENAKKQPANN